MQRGLSRCAAAATFLSMGSAAFAALPRDFCPRKGGAIDPAAAVDKDELAASLLDAHQVPRRFEPRVAPLRKASPELDALSDRAFLLLEGTNLCKELACSKAEANALADASQALVRIALTPQPGISVSPLVARPEDFFLRADVTLRCLPTSADVDASGTTAGPEGGFSLSRIRLRGAASDLLFKHGGAGYADASKATFSYEDDRAAKTKSTQLAAAIGYTLPLGQGGTPRTDRPFVDWALRAIPYAAFNIDTARAASQARTEKSNQFDTGAMIELLWTRVAPVPSGVAGAPPDFVHQDNYLGVYPHYRIDYKDHSAILGVNFLYRPYVMRGFNSPVPLAPGITGYFLGDVRFNSGHFTRIGTRDPAASGDFSRFGGRLGFYIGSSEGFPVPFDLTVSGVYMEALAGDPHHLAQLKADLGLYFTAKKNFGVDFAYSRGRAEDLDEREHKFTFGLAVKY